MKNAKVASFFNNEKVEDSLSAEDIKLHQTVFNTLEKFEFDLKSRLFYQYQLQ